MSHLYQALKEMIIEAVPLQPKHPPEIFTSSHHVKHHIQKHHGITISERDVVMAAREIPQIALSGDEGDFAWLQRKEI